MVTYRPDRGQTKTTVAAYSDTTGVSTQTEENFSLPMRRKKGTNVRMKRPLSNPDFTEYQQLKRQRWGATGQGIRIHPGIAPENDRPTPRDNPAPAPRGHPTTPQNPATGETAEEATYIEMETTPRPPPKATQRSRVDLHRTLLDDDFGSNML